MKLNVIASGLAVVTLCNAAAVTLPVVDLGYAVHQATLNSSGPEPYLNFSNIRFGQAPVGPLRFSSPLAPEGRNATVNNGQQGFICAQANPAWELTATGFVSAYLTGGNITEYTNPPTSTSPSNVTLPPAAPFTSEDCLFLDVIVPETIYNSVSAKKKRQDSYAVQCNTSSTASTPCIETPINGTGGAPVLVWIYGGGYTSGSKASTGNPASLVARSLQNGNEGVVYVAMNYRLGLFGWLAGSDNVTANAALLDQRLALDWVQENIHLFGGDPSRVTVMGESAGAGSIMHHITSYGGDGNVPFQQAIPQSPAFQPIVPAQSEVFFKEVLGNASLITQANITSANDLRALPFEALFALNTIIVGGSAYSTFTFGPAVDPTPGSYVPDFPLHLLAQGKYHHDVKLLVGHNSNEGLFFTPPAVQTQEDYVVEISGTFPTANESTVSTVTDVLYPPIFNGTYGYTDAIGRTALAIADLVITCNAYLLASTLESSYAYYFSVPPGLHGEDVSYTFFNGDTTTSDDGLPVQEDIAVPFQEFLLNFTMNGTPGEGAVLYGSNNTVSNVGFGTFGTLVKDPAARPQCAFWEAAPYYESS